jgi:hypothetical protein
VQVVWQQRSSLVEQQPVEEFGVLTGELDANHALVIERLREVAGGIVAERPG